MAAMPLAARPKGACSARASIHCGPSLKQPRAAKPRNPALDPRAPRPAVMRQTLEERHLASPARLGYCLAITDPALRPLDCARTCRCAVACSGSTRLAAAARSRRGSHAQAKAGPETSRLDPRMPCPGLQHAKLDMLAFCSEAWLFATRGWLTPRSPRRRPCRRAGEGTLCARTDPEPRARHPQRFASQWPAGARSIAGL